MIAPNRHEPTPDYEGETDVQLMHRVREGDDIAFSHLMSRHRKYVIWTLSQLIGNQHDLSKIERLGMLMGALQAYLKNYEDQGDLKQAIDAWIYANG